MDELWLVRHGESVANVAAIRAEAQGLELIPVPVRDADVPLSERGREQAEALGIWWRRTEHRIERVWVSPYLRARETLRIAVGPSRPSTAVDERLRDHELGVLELLTQIGVSRRHPEEDTRRARLGKFLYRPPGGESWADVVLRLRSFLGDAAAEPASTGLIVAHDAVVMLMLYVLLGFDEQELLEFEATHTVLNASLTHLLRHGARWEIVAFSDVSHLPGE
jgi:probable phosphoglycerate mutase